MHPLTLTLNAVDLSRELYFCHSERSEESKSSWQVRSFAAGGGSG